MEIDTWEPETEEERIELYKGLMATGLSDYEARATAWPTH